MNILPHEKRCAIFRCLVDGCSVRATGRITGATKNTIHKLTRDLGQACLEFQDNALRNLTCQRIQTDEIWNFCYAKEQNLSDRMRGQPGVGSMWTWTAMCSDTKVIVSWQLGARGANDAHAFMRDVSERLANRVQLTTDGHRVYLNAVEDAFGADIDYAMLVKLYGEAGEKPENRYSPGKCLGARKKRVMGEPDEDYISTSYAERQNLNIQMQNRRYARLTNAFSKKAEMLAHSISIMFCYHNFVRTHQTLKTTPAIAMGIDSHKWSIGDLVDLLPLPAGSRG